mgnify:FL=1
MNDATRTRLLDWLATHAGATPHTLRTRFGATKEDIAKLVQERALSIEGDKALVIPEPADDN